jgi:DNA-binding response OmpR family regulator
MSAAADDQRVAGHPDYRMARRSQRQRDTRDTLEGRTILVVEDDEVSREALVVLLSEHGAHVLAAESVPEAMHLQREEHPALIVSDIGLPGDDGCTLIRRIREADSERGDRTPAIAVSGFADCEWYAFAAGFDDYLQKPLDFDVLLARVRMLLGPDPG